MPVPAALATGLLALGRLGLASHLLAGPPGNHLPLVGSVVPLRLAGTAVRRRAAVVLAGLGDAVTLLALGLGALRARRLSEPCRDQACHGRGEEASFLVHAILLWRATKF